MNLMIGLALAVAIWSQAADPSFDVASVKLNRSGDTNTLLRILPGGRLSANEQPPTSCLFGMYGGTATARSMGMSILANRLVEQVHRFVVDRTRLTGVYDYDVTYTPESAPAGDSTAPSIFTALREQLGLRLEPTRGPVEMFIIDRVNHLVPN